MIVAVTRTPVPTNLYWVCYTSGSVLRIFITTSCLTSAVSLWGRLHYCFLLRDKEAKTSPRLHSQQVTWLMDWLLTESEKPPWFISKNLFSGSASWLNDELKRKFKIMAFGPITSWQIDWETMETVTDYFGGLQNHCRWWLQPWN